MRLYVALFAGIVGCTGGTLSPFRHFAEVGTDAYAVYVDAAADGSADLFAIRAEGGATAQVTFSPVAESSPALSPDGSVIAFVRDGREVWLLNLLNGGERQLPLPKGVAARRVAWSADSRAIYAATDRGAYRLTPPPGRGAAVPVAPAEQAAAESSLAVLLGTPAFARAGACATGGVCTTSAEGTSVIAPDGHDPARWGADSLAYFVGNRLLIRPLGAGRAREMRFERPPVRPRELTYFPGKPSGGPSETSSR